MNLLVDTVQPITMMEQDFPGGSVAKTPHSQCRGPRFNK